MEEIRIKQLTDMVKNGYKISFDEASKLYNSDEIILGKYANDIRKYCLQDKFDLCSIVNAKCGNCTEDCKFCSQSNRILIDNESCVISTENAVNQAKLAYKLGIKRFSLVTAGRTLSQNDYDKIIEICKEIKRNCSINLCCSSGLLTYNQLKGLYEVGVTRYHNNLETSREFFPNICTMHTYQDKLATIKNAKLAGLEVCSGGIIGMGESVADRINLSLTLRELGIKSTPINVLNAIKGTPLENIKPLSFEEISRTVSVFRFVLPDSYIRLAGGRIVMDGYGYELLNRGINATITGDMLTTKGITAVDDIKTIESYGYKIN